MNELAKRVKNFRLDMELSQAEFARKAGISLRSIVNFESGELDGCLFTCKVDVKGWKCDYCKV